MVSAWTGPTAAPPNNNTPEPINVSATSQYKTGAFGVGGILHAYSNAYFDGNVGIGTAEPGQKLTVNGSNTYIEIKSSNNYAGIILRNIVGGEPKSAGVYLSDDRLDLERGGSPRVSITGNGNVGIGTTAPTEHIDAAGYVKGRTGLCIGNDCRNSWPAGGGGIQSLGQNNCYRINYGQPQVMCAGGYYVAGSWDDGGGYDGDNGMICCQP